MKFKLILVMLTILLCFISTSCGNKPGIHHLKVVDIYIHNIDNISYNNVALYLEVEPGNLSFLTNAAINAKTPHFSIDNEHSTSIVIRIELDNAQYKDFAFTLPREDPEFNLFLTKDNGQINLVEH